MSKRPSPTIAASVSRFLRDDNGATSIEYALIASGIGAVLAATIVNLGTTVKGLYTSVNSAMH